MATKPMLQWSKGERGLARVTIGDFRLQAWINHLGQWTFIIQEPQHSLGHIVLGQDNANREAAKLAAEAALLDYVRVQVKKCQSIESQLVGNNQGITT